MLLDHRFYRLPITVDAGLIESEMRSASSGSWIAHPQGYVGNSALPLVSVDGADNHAFWGDMVVCPRTELMPYVKQVLANLNTSIGRSRLMRLSAGANVPPHSDTNLYWRKRMRIHIPIISNESVVFESGGQTQQMEVGEVWVMDTWHTHSVRNDGGERIHLVADTLGSPEFWAMLKTQSWTPSKAEDMPPDDFSVTHISPWHDDTKVISMLKLESSYVQAVLCPEEVTDIIDGYCGDLDNNCGPDWVCKITRILQTLGRNWQDVWETYGDAPQHYMRYRLVVLHAVKQLKGMTPEPLLQTNRQPVARLLMPLISPFGATSLDSAPIFEAKSGLRASSVSTDPSVQAGQCKIVRGGDTSEHEVNEIKLPEFEPIFIVAAPRSGSTLLFETLSRHDSLLSYNSESHHLIESIPSLSMQANGSNELNASHAEPPIPEQLKRLFLARLPQAKLASKAVVTFLEKTPKNALRVDFLKAAFPNARFIYLYRQPHTNVSSIIEGWKSKRFITYKNLQGWNSGYDWSFLLPADWRALPIDDLAVVAAHQYTLANKAIITSLAAPTIDNKNTGLAVAYEDFVQNTGQCLQRICRFLDLPWSESFDGVLNATEDLPLSKYTLTGPSSEKWRENEVMMQAVLPKLKKYYQDEVGEAVEQINARFNNVPYS